MDLAKQYQLSPIILVGTKSDLEENREAQTTEGEALAELLGIPFFKASIKAVEVVNRVF